MHYHANGHAHVLLTSKGGAPLASGSAFFGLALDSSSQLCASAINASLPIYALNLPVSARESSPPPALTPPLNRGSSRIRTSFLSSACMPMLPHEVAHPGCCTRCYEPLTPLRPTLVPHTRHGAGRQRAASLASRWVSPASRSSTGAAITFTVPRIPRNRRPGACASGGYQHRYLSCIVSFGLAALI